MRLLVVDDDRGLRDVLRRALSLSGYEIVLAATGSEALSEVTTAVPDAVVLDVGLPDIDGLEVCRLLRREGNRVPVLMLTARDAVSDRIDGLDAGADDYLVKPFDIDDVKTRMRVLLHGAGGEPTVDRALSFVDLRLDSARHGVTVGENFVELTRTEFQLLELLMLNPRRVLPHTLIYDRVWGYDFGPTSNALRVYVGYLRRKLEEAGARAQIHTVRGVGHALGPAGAGRPVPPEPDQEAAGEHRDRPRRRALAAASAPVPEPDGPRGSGRGTGDRSVAPAGLRRRLGDVHGVQARRRHVGPTR